jgi:hypothetical protein
MTSEQLYELICGQRALDGEDCPLIAGLAAWTQGDEIALAWLERGRPGVVLH